MLLMIILADRRRCQRHHHAVGSGRSVAVTRNPKRHAQASAYERGGGMHATHGGGTVGRYDGRTGMDGRAGGQATGEIGHSGQTRGRAGAAGADGWPDRRAVRGRPKVEVTEEEHLHRPQHAFLPDVLHEANERMPPRLSVPGAKETY